MSRPLRIALIAVAAVIGLTVAGGAVFLVRFDPDSLKPAIIQAVRRATGRDLALTGPISLRLSLRPAIRAMDVAFANPAGFSRSEMATLQSMDLQLSVLALLSGQIRIDRLVLIRPDILLEINAAGDVNWRIVPEPAAPRIAPQTTQTETSNRQTATSFAIETLVIQDGTIAYRDGATGKAATFAISKLTASAATPDSGLRLDTDASYNGTGFTLAARTGSLTRLLDKTAASPWPVKLVLTAGAAKSTVEGSIAQPLRGKGYDLAIAGSVPDTEALTPMVPGYTLPSLHDVSFSARIAGNGASSPAVSALILHAGASDLGTYAAGLALNTLDIDAPGLDQPMKIVANATLRDTPVTVAGSVGSPALLMPDAKPAPFPVDLTMQLAGATATAKGTIADVRAMTGATLAVSAKIADLSAETPLWRHPLPALKSMALNATVSDTDGGFQHGIALHGLLLISPDGDVSGDARLDFGPRPSLIATLASNRIDLDAVLSAFNQMPTPAPALAPALPPVNAAPPRQAARHAETRLFSTEPLPFGLLRAADADLSLKIATIRTEGAEYRAIDARAVLSGGKLTIDPFAAELPGGHLTGTLSVDATSPEPPVHLTLRAPGLALKTMLVAAQQPPYATGTMEVYADLGGTGDSPHALAASLDGTIGLAMTAGTLDNRLLGSLLGTVNPSLSALDLVRNGGTTAIRCFGLRAASQRGTGTIQALALSSSLLTMTGGGTVDLGAETLAMMLRPRVRIGGAGVVIPVALSGPIRDPAAKVNQLSTADAGAEIAANLLGGGKSDVCPTALAAARGQAVPDAAPATADSPSVPDPSALLKKLFR